ncbi:MAG: transglycosylase [Candidatus Dadabacteria bacterium]|nr:MAG: transglycosylase [Candidatus Dadabacteria bacterium]
MKVQPTFARWWCAVGRLVTTRGFRAIGVAVAAAGLVSGCYGIRVTVQWPEPAPYRVMHEPTRFADDLDFASLRKALEASEQYFAGAPRSAVYRLGGDSYTTQQIARSVRVFSRIVDSTDPRRLSRRLARECRAYRPRQTAQFTAYYEPILEASLRRTERFRYPIYRKPDELTLVRLARFFPGDPRQFHGHVRGGELFPYLTREEIDGRGLLRGRGLELAWVDDPVALYFLHVQGSGRLRLRDGRVMRINYAASNGLPYFSVGRYLLDQGMIERGSVGAIRAYLEANPERRDEILFKNPRYIFFREVELSDDEGPVGSLGVPLVAGRSVATDHRFVPPGAVVFIDTKQPRVDSAGRLIGWKPLERFAVNLDSGAAIKGPARVDIYWGEGEQAGTVAGYMNQPGRLTVLICGVRPYRTLVARGALFDWQRVPWPAASGAAGL